MAHQTKIAGILLAGGKSLRMGSPDKCLQVLAGKTILEHVIERVKNQVDLLILNANGDPERFSSFELPVVPDVIEGYAGPLAGLLSGMEWLIENATDYQWVVTFATDTPFVPTNLVSRLFDGLEQNDNNTQAENDMACAKSGQQAHPVFGLWPLSLVDDLRCALFEEDIRKIINWTRQYNLAHVEYAVSPLDPFFNTNKPSDLIEAQNLYSEHHDYITKEL